MEYPKLHYAVATLYQRSLRRQQLKADLKKSAEAVAAAGHFSEAIDLYEDLASNGADQEARYALAMVYFRSKRFREAWTTLIRCLQGDRYKAEYHFRLGRILSRCGYPRDAVHGYLGVMTAGLAGYCGGETPLQPHEAVSVAVERCAGAYGQALITAPGQPRLYLSLGHLRLVQNRMDDAALAYEAAVGIDPWDVYALESLAFVLKRKNSLRSGLVSAKAYYAQGRYTDAVRHYRRSLEKEVSEPGAYEELADCYYKLHEYQKVVDVCREGTKKDGIARRFYLLWVRALLRSGRTAEAIGCATEASTSFPDDIQLAGLRYLSLPIVYGTQEDVSEFRSRFQRGLERLISTVDLAIVRTPQRALEGIQSNFYLAYQGKNDRRLNERHGSLVTRIMRKNYPQWSKHLRMPPLSTGDDRIRVGYFSSFLRSHTVGKLFIGWLAHHNRERFDVRAYYPHETGDVLSSEVESLVDHFHRLPDLESICRQVRADKLHVLVILDIGMNPLSTKIGGLRLAPVQCLTWGHPVTSGLPNIDYFISSELMEPHDAQEHYSETLIRLPGIGISVPRPFPGDAQKTRSDFGLPERAAVYLSPQSVFKYLPRYDYVFPAIARRVRHSKFVFLEDTSRALTDIFRKRLLAAFREFSLNGSRHVVFLPRQDHLSYLQLNKISDVFLDTPGWSGGMTTLEALGCTLPVVTCPGQFMRGRHSFAFLRQLGVTDTIAKNMDDYVELAASLGANARWRQLVSSKIGEHSNRLYDDDSCVRALEKFYRRVVLKRG